MSLFGSFMGDFGEEDPYFGTHMRQMNNMMNSFFSDPFGMMGPPAIMGGNQVRHGMQMMPFGFPQMPDINQMFNNFNNMSQNGNCHSFSSSSVMTMTNGPDGRPQVYQESMSTRTAPGGIKETKKTVADSRSGTKKMAIGHHIGDRAHILERERNLHSGDQEERQEFINLDEEEADSFNREWQAKTRHSMSAISAPNYRSHNSYSRGHRNEMLALPSTASSSTQNSRLPKTHSRHQKSKGPQLVKKKNSDTIVDLTGSEEENTYTQLNAASTTPKTFLPSSKITRKREHPPEVEVLNTKQSKLNNAVANPSYDDDDGDDDKEITVLEKDKSKN